MMADSGDHNRYNARNAQETKSDPNEQSRAEGEVRATLKGAKRIESIVRYHAHIFFAPCLVRENIKTDPRYSPNTFSKRRGLSCFCTKKSSWVTFSAVVPDGAISTRVGSFIYCFAITTIFDGIVAEKSIV